ncbi:hypothetical protein PSCICP_16850 [Pseudomonas cichorii]|uniref:Uncharacterized protein n=1 Tax=Pseudomonas cichorii TaxID=36746 RepID=A0ABQ1DL26_PSECI|nr:hypothetical protein PSCICP_16850 [Pseudomonas cichorii]
MWPRSNKHNETHKRGQNCIGQQDASDPRHDVAKPPVNMGVGSFVPVTGHDGYTDQYKANIKAGKRYDFGPADME